MGSLKGLAVAFYEGSRVLGLKVQGFRGVGSCCSGLRGCV